MPIIGTGNIVHMEDMVGEAHCREYGGKWDYTNGGHNLPPAFIKILQSLEAPAHKCRQNNLVIIVHMSFHGQWIIGL